MDKTEERFHIRSRKRFWPVENALSFFLTGFNTTQGDMMAEEINLPDKKLGFLRITTQFVSSKSVHDQVNMFDVFINIL